MKTSCRKPNSGSAFDELVSSLDIATPAATYDDYRLSFDGAQAMEMGQPLLSAALERPMRDRLRFLKGLVPDDDDDFMGDRELILVADDEMRVFKKWLDDVSLEPHIKSHQTKGFGLGGLAASFFLGTWLGGGE